MIPGRCCHRLWLALLLTGCGAKSHILFAEDAGEETPLPEPDASVDAGGIPGCDDPNGRLPDTLECTGLFDNIIDKTVTESARPFTPAFPLWSDGADKHRWIQLPPGTQIDNSAPNDWVFPVGTKVWKEFKVGGKRIETRIYWKVRSDLWRRGAYVWNAEETQAEFSLGGDIDIASGKYHVPEPDECNDCHEGQPDRVLGFSAISLGLSGATGITLAQLADEGWLTEKPALVELSIGADSTGLDDDGIPLVAKALGTLHTNCGVTCHNPSAGATANLTNQNLRLDVTLLDGRAADATFNVLRTAVGQAAQGAQWGGGHMRIIPGNPDQSLVVQLMSYRNPAGKGNGQMPPIATRVVDDVGVTIMRKWISRLGGGAADAGPSVDASGPSDAGPSMDGDAASADAGMDADTQVDADSLDAGMDTGDNQQDSGDDAGTLDAAPDADEPDADAAPTAALDSDADSPDATAS